jgi:hypothetical protein
MIEFSYGLATILPTLKFESSMIYCRTPCFSGLCDVYLSEKPPAEGLTYDYLRDNISVLIPPLKVGLN